MGIFDNLKKDADKAGKHLQKGVHTVKQKAGHAATSATKTAKDTGQKVAQTADKTAKDAEKTVNQGIKETSKAVNHVVSSSEEFLKRSSQLVNTQLDKKTQPFDGHSIAEFATTAQHIAVEFAGKVNGEAKSICLVIDRAEEQTMEAASHFLSEIAEDFESLLNWLASSALYQPIANTLNGLLEMMPDFIEQAKGQVTHGDTDLIKKQIEDFFDQIESSLGGKQKAPKAAKMPEIKKPKMPTLDNPLEDIVKKKLKEIQNEVPDLLGLEKLVSKFDQLNLTYSMEDLVPKIPISHLVPQILGELDTMIKNFDVSHMHENLDSLNAIVMDAIIDSLDSIKTQLIEDIDKAVVYAEEHANLLIKLWEEPLAEIPFFSDFFKKQLKVPLTAGTFVLLMPAIQLTFTCMLENRGAEPFPEKEKSSKPGTTTAKEEDQKDPIGTLRSLAIASSYINILTKIGADELKFQTNLESCGKPLNPDFTLQSAKLGLTQSVLLALQIRFAIRREEINEANNEDGELPYWAYLILEILMSLAPLFLKIKALKDQKANNKILNNQNAVDTTNSEEEELHRYKPNDETNTFLLTAQLVTGIFGLTTNANNSPFNGAMFGRNLLQSVNAYRLSYLDSRMNSVDGEKFESFSETGEWKVDTDKIFVNSGNVAQINVTSELARAFLYQLAAVKPS